MSRKLLAIVSQIYRISDETWFDARSYASSQATRLSRLSSTLEAIEVAKLELRRVWSTAPSLAFVNGWELAVAISELYPHASLIIALDTTPDLIGRQSLRISSSPIRRIAVQAVTSWNKRRFRRALEQTILALPMSTQAEQSLRSHGKYRGKSIVTYCPQGDDIISKERIEDDGRALLFVGNDFVRKGGQLLYQLMRTSLHDFRLTVVSNDPEAHFDTPPNVSVKSGLNDPRELWPIYLSSSMLLLPSKREQLPNVIGEALAAGVVPISTDVGAIGELVHDGYTGFLVPSGAAADVWSERILHLAANRQLWVRLSAAGRDFARKFLSQRMLEEQVRLALAKRAT